MAGKKGFVKGTIVGAVLGSVAALLLAPKSGKELRGDIKSSADKISDKLADISKELLREAKKVEKKGIVKAKKQTLAAVKEARILSDNLERKAAQFKKKGLRVRREVVKDTRDAVAKSAQVLKELQKELGAKPKTKRRGAKRK